MSREIEVPFEILKDSEIVSAKVLPPVEVAPGVFEVYMDTEMILPADFHERMAWHEKTTTGEVN